MEVEDEEKGIDVRDIDAQWLKRELVKYFIEESKCEALIPDTLNLLDPTVGSMRQCEANLLDLFEYEHQECVMLLAKNRTGIFYQTQIHRVDSQAEKASLLTKLQSSAEGRQVLQDIKMNKQKQLSSHLDKAATLTSQFKSSETD